MRSLRPRPTATDAEIAAARLCARGLLAVLLLAGVMAGGGAWAAQVAGIVVNLSGPLMDRKADGTIKVLGVKSEIESGDTLVTEKNTYAQIRFIDNGEITLRPGTTFTVEQFAYEAGKPEADSASFSLIKGGLRSITGLLGKRNKDKFLLKTPSATIGIRGTIFIAQYVDPMGGPGTQSALPPGLHVNVTDGAIVVTNPAGSQGFVAGQFGFVPGMTQPPVIVPPNPGLQFTPPPAFNAGTPPGGASGASQTKTAAVDCVVR